MHVRRLSALAGWVLALAAPLAAAAPFDVYYRAGEKGNWIFYGGPVVDVEGGGGGEGRGECQDPAGEGGKAADVHGNLRGNERPLPSIRASAKVQCFAHGSGGRSRS